MTAAEIMAHVWHEIGCANRPTQSNGAHNPRGTTFEGCKFQRVHLKTAKEAFRRMAEEGYHVRYEPPEAESLPLFGQGIGENFGV